MSPGGIARITLKESPRDETPLDARKPAVAAARRPCRRHEDRTRPLGVPQHVEPAADAGQAAGGDDALPQCGRGLARHLPEGRADRGLRGGGVARRRHIIALEGELQTAGR